MERRSVSEALRRLVTERAGDRCEYCKLSQVCQEATFHVDHVKPRVEGGETELHNLALACVSCSLRKGARQYVVDVDSGQTVRLFNPREQDWDEHFAWAGEVVLEGRTDVGRATVAALDLNRPVIRAIRRVELLFGRHPPS